MLMILNSEGIVFVYHNNHINKRDYESRIIFSFGLHTYCDIIKDAQRNVYKYL